MLKKGKEQDLAYLCQLYSKQRQPPQDIQERNRQEYIFTCLVKGDYGMGIHCDQG